MRNIVLCRVDDRLIHGEVVAEWLPSVLANIIMVVDEQMANDVFSRRLIQLLSPKGTTANVYSIGEATTFLNGKANDDEKIMILAKSPTTFLKLVENGISIPKINIGGMGLMGQRKIVYKNIACSIEELTCIHNLLSLGCDVYYQLVPAQPNVNFSKILSNKKL